MCDEFIANGFLVDSPFQVLVSEGESVHLICRVGHLWLIRVNFFSVT